jgi:hypothetical protein
MLLPHSEETPRTDESHAEVVGVSIKDNDLGLGNTWCGLNTYWRDNELARQLVDPSSKPLVYVNPDEIFINPEALINIRNK